MKQQQEERQPFSSYKKRGDHTVAQLQEEGQPHSSCKEREYHEAATRRRTAMNQLQEELQPPSSCKKRDNTQLEKGGLTAAARRGKATQQCMKWDNHTAAEEDRPYNIVQEEGRPQSSSKK
jgi:hypothetical protein